jgi:hypothetical protein
MHVCHHIMTSLRFFESSNFKLRRIQMLLVESEGTPKYSVIYIYFGRWMAPRTRFCFISSMAVSEMGRPSCFSAIASVSQSWRQV